MSGPVKKKWSLEPGAIAGHRITFEKIIARASSETWRDCGPRIESFISFNMKSLEDVDLRPTIDTSRTYSGTTTWAYASEDVFETLCHERRLA